MNGIDWFPQDWAHTFYLWKGLAALVGTLLLVVHMIRKTEPMTLGQTLRYVTLLYLAALITGSTIEQTNQDAVVNYRNLAVIPGLVLLIVAAGVSLYESRRRN